MKTAPLGVLALVCLETAACPSKGPPGDAPLFPGDTCSGARCETIDGRRLGDPPGIVAGANVRVFDFARCGIEAAWPVGGQRFQATLYPPPRELFPLPDGLVKIHCWDERVVGDRPAPPAARVTLDPVSPLPRLARGDAFIPLGGEATLDGDLYASATVEQRAPSKEPLTVSIGVKPTRGDEAGFHRLREGDSFRWGGRDASVVRIVVSADIAAGAIDQGWVEVRLSDGPPASSPPRPPDRPPP